MPHLTDAQNSVFKLYKGNSPFLDQTCFADFINTTLGRGEPLPAAWEALAVQLDALIKSDLLQSVTTLYRAMSDSYLACHIQNGVLSFPAYMSTATDELAIRRHFSTPYRDIPGALLRIDCDIGTPALDMETAKSHGGFEQERLLSRHSTFAIDGIETLTDKNRMEELMTPMYAKNYSMLKIYQLKYIK
ncbi:ADP-ribosyltransferase [Achromobacter aloeverae]